MYDPLLPLPFGLISKKLRRYDVLRSEAPSGPAGPMCVFRQFRMGFGTASSYVFPDYPSDTIVPEPMLASLLDYFEIGHAEFMECEAADLEA